MRQLTILALSLFVSISVCIVLSVHASAQEYSIPSWIKNMTKWWSQGQTSDSDFIKAMQYLIDNNVLHT
ncbi:Uncharacterised protein [uncultured archaeon]|nr:Uncharacterised protein [uncultured archaeon]